MLCDQCGQHEATVKFVQIEDNTRTEHHFCKSCAQGYASFSPGFDLQHLLSSMFQSAGLGQKLEKVFSDKKCPTCARSIVDIQKTGRLGCGTCYEVFQDELNAVLRRIHGSNTHTGKVPIRTYPKVQVTRQIEDLRKRLDECVRQENYEQAAKHRDELRLLEIQLAGGESS